MTTVTSVPRSEQSAQPGQELLEPGSFHDVPGWFFRTDVILFDWFLNQQRQLGLRGDLLEMGSYMGKSAVMMRAYLDPPREKFTVCDLFDSEAPDDANGREMRGSYSTLTRRAFEANFLSFHDDLPRIVQAPTSVVPDEVAPGSCRFVHVDASHLYEHVRGDIAAAEQALAPGGLLAMDDYRSEHTPGVACATWQAVLESGLRPVCVSGHKFYGTWGEAEPWQEALHTALTARDKCWLQWQEVAGRRMLLVGARKADAPDVPVSRHARGATAQSASTGTSRRRGAAKKVAVDLLPPVVTRALVSARRRRRAGRAGG